MLHRIRSQPRCPFITRQNHQLTKPSRSFHILGRSRSRHRWRPPTAIQPKAVSKTARSPKIAGFTPRWVIRPQRKTASKRAREAETRILPRFVPKAIDTKAKYWKLNIKRSRMIQDIWKSIQNLSERLRILENYL